MSFYHVLIVIFSAIVQLLVFFDVSRLEARKNEKLESDIRDRNDSLSYVSQRVKEQDFWMEKNKSLLDDAMVSKNNLESEIIKNIKIEKMNSELIIENKMLRKIVSEKK